MKDVVAVIAGVSGEAVTKELHKRGKKVVLLCGAENEAGSDIADDVLVADFSLKEKIYDYLAAKGVEEVILSTGPLVALQLCEYLESKGILASVDVKVALVAKNKTMYKEALLAKGFLAPAHFSLEQKDEVDDKILDEIANKVGLPCVVKSPIDKNYPQLASDKQSLKNAILEVQELQSPVLLEQYVNGIECTVPVVSDYENIHALLVNYYSKAKECHLKGFKDVRQGVLSKEQEQKVMDFLEKALRATGIIGTARVDVMVDDLGEIYILECNNITVTGMSEKYKEFSEHFLQKENIDMPKILVDNAEIIFSKKRKLKNR